MYRHLLVADDLTGVGDRRHHHDGGVRLPVPAENSRQSADSSSKAVRVRPRNNSVCCVLELTALSRCIAACSALLKELALRCRQLAVQNMGAFPVLEEKHLLSLTD